MADTKGIAVQYFGREAPFVERNYGSGLTFDSGQTRVVPDGLAELLLRHADVFAKGEGATTPEKTESGDSTQVQLEAAAKKQALQEVDINQRQDLVDQINLMDKDALKNYASIKYGQPLPKTLSVKNMRAKVVQLIDQFGAL